MSARPSGDTLSGVPRRSGNRLWRNRYSGANRRRPAPRQSIHHPPRETDRSPPPFRRSANHRFHSENEMMICAESCVAESMSAIPLALPGHKSKSEMIPPPSMWQ